MNSSAEMNADMIVGGFPCQDYSVARSKKNEQGIEGQRCPFSGKSFERLGLLDRDFLF